MKRSFVCCLALVILGVIIAGCTSTTTAGPAPATPTATAAAAPVSGTTAAVSATPTIPLGGHYIQKSYSFHNTNDHYTEQLRIDNQSWALVYTVTPLSDDAAAGWFELTITNVDSKKSQTFGYGRNYTSDTFQQYPMYGTGSYQLAMKGNLTKIDLDVAERRP
jgi:hypothetical protein